MSNRPTNPNQRQPLAESLPPDPGVKITAGAVRKAQGRQIRRTPELDALLREVNLLRLRGETDSAANKIQIALKTDRDNFILFEMLGDLWAQTGRTTEAIQAYQQAELLGAGTVVESKIARILAQRAETSHMDSDSQLLYRGNSAGPLIASALIPGLGLALVGEMTTAAICFGGWLVCSGLIFLIPPVREAVSALTGHSRASGLGDFLLVVLGITSLGFYVYSLMETVRQTKDAEKDGIIS